MDRPAFVYVTYIATTPEKLWQALTDGAFTQQYWAGTRLDSTWAPGASVTFRMGDEVYNTGAEPHMSRIGGCPIVGKLRFMKSSVANGRRG